MDNIQLSLIGHVSLFYLKITHNQTNFNTKQVNGRKLAVNGNFFTILAFYAKILSLLMSSILYKINSLDIALHHKKLELIHIRFQYKVI